MAISERISEETYLRLALRDPDGQWELHRGRLREKPGMSIEHNDLITEIGYELRRQLSRGEYRVRFNTGRIRHPADSYYIPDIMVIPAHLERAGRGWPPRLEVYRDPLPLVVWVWSPSTGRYDIYEKLPDYQQRGDLEIWYVHPYERTLTAWRRRTDGSYSETFYREGVVRPTSLPGVEIDLAALFD